MKKSSFIKKIFQDSLLANSFTLFVGTGFSKILPIAVTPFLTRMYAVEDFGVLAIFVSIASIVSVFSTGLYDLAIMLPREKDRAETILNLTFVLTTLVSIIFFVAVLFFSSELADLFGSKSIEPFLYLIPFMVIALSMTRSFSYFNNRSSRFKLTSMVGVVQSLGTSAFQILLGVLLYTKLGLIVGTVAGACIGFVYIYFKTPDYTRKASLFRLSNMYQEAKNYKKLLLVSSWGSLLNTISTQLPIFYITSAFSADLTGVFSFVFRVINLPLGLISNSIMQVFFKEVADLQRDAPENIKKMVIKAGSFLFVVALLAIAILSWQGENLFVLVFGQKWAAAGKVAGLMSIAAGIKFIVSPLSSVLIIDKYLTRAAKWKTLYFITTLVVLEFATKLEFNTFLKWYVIHELILYSLYFYLIYSAAHAEGVEGKVGEANEE